MMTRSDMRHVNIAVTSAISLTGLFVWWFGASEWVWQGYFYDPVVAKVGKAICVAACPMWAFSAIQRAMAGDFQKSTPRT